MPALERKRVLVEFTGAETVRSLIVKVSGEFPEVVASIVTVLVVSFVMRMVDCVLVGGTPSDQLLASFPFIAGSRPTVVVGAGGVSNKDSERGDNNCGSEP